MQFKLGTLVGGLMLAVVSFGLLGPVATAAAEEPEMVGEVEAPYFFGEDAAMPHWLRYSIVYCAAKAMDVDVDAVKMGLRNGHSLKEIGIRAGVRPLALEAGILRCESHLLERLVHAGELEPPEARRIWTFVYSHITRIINYSWDG